MYAFVMAYASSSKLHVYILGFSMKLCPGVKIIDLALYLFL